MHAACWKGRGNRRVSRNFRPGGRETISCRRSFTPETFRVVATLPESLFLKALTEGLLMIRPGAVDICRPVMVRYSVIYGVTR